MEEMEEIVQEQFTAAQQLINTIIEFFVNYSFNVLGAIIVLVVGFWIASQLANIVVKLLSKKNIDITLTKFAAGCVKLTILTFAIIIALGKFGITITPFIAALGGLIFGASFAFQGPLSNFFSGLVIILTRPFTVGDTITVQEQYGVVDEVKLGTTILTTEDGVRITIPNKHIVGEILHNSKQYRIVDGVVGVSYNSDMDKAIQTVLTSILEVEAVGKSPNPQVGIKEFADSSVNIGMRYWAPTDKYYQTLYEVNSKVFKALKDANITIPFPQRDVHMVDGGSAPKP